MNEELTKDLEKLTGKSVLYGHVECVIAGCHPDLGITLVEKDTNPPVYMFCLHGPLSAKYKGKQLSIACYNDYYKLFNDVVSVIKSGHMPKTAFSYYLNGNSPSAESCPFGQ